MFYIEPKSTDIAFNLAAEEYIMRNFPETEPVFMFWRTEKCVIIGRYQIAAAEIDLQAAHSLGIQIIRRSSGGGAVFSDPGNIMHSLITPFHQSSDDAKNIEREQSAGPIARALNKMGINAIAEGRNDILADGKKISGYAQYALKNRLCTHGSLLYNADLDLLEKVLKTDPEKISSKALKSVRARVMNLCEYFDPPITAAVFLERLKLCLLNEMNAEYYEFTEKDIKEINRIRSEKYANPEWITGNTPRFSFHNSKRFAAGKIEIFLDVEHGIIKACQIFGDFLGVFPVGELEEKLISRPHDFGALSEILTKIDLRFYLGGIKLEELLECLF